MPDNYEELIKLPNVGDYVASCVLALGYKIPTPMVDVNVKRVIGRMCGTQVDVRRAYLKMCPKDVFAQFHYAVLDLAQLVCRHVNPKCYLCPIKEDCSATCTKL